MSHSANNAEGIAIVGMAGRFPGARNIDEFWRNLRDGVETVSFFTDDELAASGVDFPKGNPHYVKARGLLADPDLFDAAFFGVNPREAEITDPQHRVFLECAWEALESAGCDPENCDGPIGVFAGMSMNTYFASNLRGHGELMASLNAHQIMLANDKDFLPTRVSYKLNLRGPSLNIQTACSTSLVAVCVACQSLLNFQCDMALAGAVAISFPRKQGHLHQEGGIGSPDGHCRAFDALAAGTVAGEGVGIVVLKRLADALADGDQIYAVIKGFAINNDGAAKMGYTAPCVEGQAEVIAAAQAMAGFELESISYVEAHGTGTPLGDPIEIEGLTRAFRAGTSARQFCAIGSLKTNIGHLDVAAGVAGLIKTALALHHRQLPPSLHFERPNPKIDFANSPFHVINKLSDWNPDGAPRRAGVSSFGIGGTNAHVVLEQAPALQPSSRPRPAQLLVLSARTPAALDTATANLAAHLKQQPGGNLADVAYTLQVGRRAFAHRRALVCRDAHEAVECLESCDARRVSTRICGQENPPVVFMFPGQGAQQVNMGREPYESEPVFRENVDLCAEMLRPHLKLDLRTVLYPGAGQAGEAQPQLTQTRLTQPALFVIEYALTRLWMSWGVQPAAMIGHSIGEYVAACLAGVFPLESALNLVAARGNLMQQQPTGSMLAVRLAEVEVKELLGKHLSLAAVNAPSLCVVSGPGHAIEALQKALGERGVGCRLLQTSHAFHSTMMDDMVSPFAALVKQFNLCAPKIPFVSNVTGRWITSAEATDPDYWACHVRHTVRFADGLCMLLKELGRVYLEVGPGQTLSNLARQQSARNPDALILSSLATTADSPGELTAFLKTSGQLWLAGLQVDWQGVHLHEQRHRVSLPAYPFERERYWVEPAKLGEAGASSRDSVSSVHPVSASTRPMRAAGGMTKEVPVPHSSRSDSPPHARGADRILSEIKSLLGSLSGLNVSTANPDTRFVELGFDSLALTQVSVALERTFGVSVAFRQLLEGLSTFGTLAAHVAAATAVDEDVCAPPIHIDESDAKPIHQGAGTNGRAKVPLTDAQRELWYACQLGESASCAFNETRLMHLRGPLHVVGLRKAIQDLVCRHEALRTGISTSGDTQQSVPWVDVQVPCVDISGASQADRDAILSAACDDETRRPFNLSQPPLLRARIMKLAEQHHLLIITIHHIVCDGRSFGVLLHDLAALYTAAVRGAVSPLPSAVQLGAYAQRQERQRLGSEPAISEAYWVKTFADRAPLLELPADRPRPSIWQVEGARTSRPVDAALTSEIKRFGSRHGCTLFTTLLSGFIALLHRLSGQDDIVVGVPIAIREAVGDDTLVAHCINFLPLRARVESQVSATGFLAATRKSFLEAHEHRHCTFGRLLQRLNLPRDPSRMPLVSVSFNVDKLEARLDFAGLDVELDASPRSSTNFDLNFNVTELGGVLRLDCRYSAALFDASTIDRWLGHFVALLRGMVDQPGECVGDLPLLTELERRQLLVEWNDTRLDYPRDKCVHELFEAQVQRTPDATAIVCGNERTTYRDLDDRAERLAGRLRELGVGPDTLVGLCLERTTEMVATILGILKAGGAYVPLDLAYPKDRLAFIIQDSGLAVLLTQEKLRAQLPAAGCELLCLDGLKRATRNGIYLPAPHSALRTPHSENLAYVLYTSGSTGQPKGVAIEHRSVSALISWARQVYQPQELRGVLASTSICFDLSVFEMFVPLCSGGAVILAENALQLPSLPEAREVTLINTVPSAITELLRLAGIPESVCTINLAGEPLSQALVDQLYQKPAIRRVFDLYGPTEDTVYSTFVLRESGGRATIGRPVANEQSYILDHRLQPVPVGVTGELFIAGDGLARGYLNRPELTAERFIQNPFSQAPGSRLYKTGDLARYLPDGNIEFLGRRDHQVKLRGYRIELGEIQSVLAQHPAVRECVAVARQEATGDKRLVAYLVPDPDRVVAISELRHFLGGKLPDYMVPSAWVVLDALPLTPNGKVNRQALPAPDSNSAESDGAFVAPGTPTEQALADIWCELLGVQRVGVRDNFFELGGHSLLVTRLIALVREGFQVELPMHRVFQTPTVAALAEAVEEMLVAEIRTMSDEEARRLVGSP